MKKIFTLLLTTVFMLIVTTACIDDDRKNFFQESKIETGKGENEMLIHIQGENNESIIFKLNGSTAAKSLYDQLPMTIEVENYSSNEKIFYPLNKLDISNTPMAKGPAGTLAYYEPWGDVVMYYGNCGGANGLYALGEAITNGEQIQLLSGMIEISKYQNTDQSAIEEDKNTELKNQETISSAKHPNDTSTNEEDEILHVQIIVGYQTFTASLYNNTSTRALIEQLPLTLDMGELHGNEKYFYFSSNLPTETENISEINAGDLKLYGNDCLVLFYKDFQTTYAYTSLGQIDNTQGLAQALGNGSVQVRIIEIDD